MRIPCIPGGTLIALLALIFSAVLIAIGAGVSLDVTIPATLYGMLLLCAVAAYDYFASRNAWKKDSGTLTRTLPAAFAIGIERPVQLNLTMLGDRQWQITIYDHADTSLITTGLPIQLTLRGNKRIECFYKARPTRRGEVKFGPADVRIRTQWRLWELMDSIGEPQTRKVFPDFAQVARYAWLAGDRRLAQIGIKSYRQRGEGTDFKQLSEYRIGDAVRHIDWKASLRSQKPIVRQFQNERDQCVILLLDCGRRMRAEESQHALGTSHFDQVLNATMLLTYVALKHGDAVGALTFGTTARDERWFAPRKGAITLNKLMGELFDVQPAPIHSDYLAAAKNLLRRHRKRSLVILITNFRDEDASELGQALQLLRSRHLVMTASLRESVVRQMSEQPITYSSADIDIASAHYYEQKRRDAFNSVAAHESLMVDAEPERLSIEIVNRYHAVKRAGMI